MIALTLGDGGPHQSLDCLLSSPSHLSSLLSSQFPLLAVSFKIRISLRIITVENGRLHEEVYRRSEDTPGLGKLETLPE